jgi:hypothetical protein
MNEPYCQFPLCSLAFDTNVDDRLDAIENYSIVERGKLVLPNYAADQREYLRAHPPEWCMVSLEDDEYLEALIGCEELNLRQPYLDVIVDDHSALSQFISQWEHRYGPDARVRLPVDWVQEALFGEGISYDQLAVIAAIYSKIGSKEGPVRITREEIWWRSLGYKSERVFKEETGGYGFCRTARQVRSIIERLDERKFFARVTFARGETYYSNRLSVKELSERVRKAKLYRARARQARIAANADLTRQIQAERRKLAGGSATEGATDTPL